MSEWWTCAACSIPNDEAYSICVSCGTGRGRAAPPPPSRVLTAGPRSSASGSRASPVSSPRRVTTKIVAPEPEPQLSISMHHSQKYSNEASARMVGLADRLISQLQPHEQVNNTANSSSSVIIKDSSISRWTATSSPAHARDNSGYQSPGESPPRATNGKAVDHQRASMRDALLTRERALSQMVDNDIAEARAAQSLGRSSSAASYKQQQPQQQLRHHDMAGSLENFFNNGTDVNYSKLSPIPRRTLGDASTSSKSHQKQQQQYDNREEQGVSSTSFDGSSELAMMRRQLVDSRLELLAVTDDRDRMMADLSQRCVAAQAQADKWRLEALSAKDAVERAETSHKEDEAAWIRQLEQERSTRWLSVPHLVVDELRLRLDTAADARGEMVSMLSSALRILSDETGPAAQGKRFSASVESFAMSRSAAIAECKEKIAALETQLSAETSASQALRLENARLSAKVDELTGHVQLQQVLASTREHKFLQELQLLRHEQRSSQPAAPS